MGQDSFIPVATNARSRSDLIERGFSRQPLRVDVGIARSLEALSHAAWSVAKDKYYDGGDRYRVLLVSFGPDWLRRERSDENH